MNHRFETLWDVTRRDANLQVQCSFHCGNESVVDAKLMQRWYGIHRWDVALPRIGKHLRCSQCLGRPEYIKITHKPPDGPRWGPKTEAEWNAVIKRLRG